MVQGSRAHKLMSLVAQQAPPSEPLLVLVCSIERAAEAVSGLPAGPHQDQGADGLPKCVSRLTANQSTPKTVDFLLVCL